LREAQPGLLAEHGRLGVAINAVTAAGRELPATVSEVAELQAEAARLGEATMAMVADSRQRIEVLLDQGTTWLKTNVADCELYVSAAETAMAAARLVDAHRDLRKADQTCRGRAPALLHFVWAQYLDGRAEQTQNLNQRQRLLAQARTRYDDFAATDTGFRAERARERSGEIADELGAATD
jgi:hypothetical protein